LQQAAGSAESEECERLWQRFGTVSRMAGAVGAVTEVPATAEIDRIVLSTKNVSERRIVVSILFRGASSS